MLHGRIRGMAAIPLICVWIDYHYRQRRYFLKRACWRRWSPCCRWPCRSNRCTESSPVTAKQPAEVALRLIAMVETLRKLGRIPLTSKGPAHQAISEQTH